LEKKDLRPEFLEGLDKIRKMIISKCTPKQINGVNLTTRIYCLMVERYVDAINSGQIPNIISALEHIEN